MEYEIRVVVKVDAEEVSLYSGPDGKVVINHEDVVKAVADALNSYRNEMVESITMTGDWDGNYQIAGASWTCEVN